MNLLESFYICRLCLFYFVELLFKGNLTIFVISEVIIPKIN